MNPGDVHVHGLVVNTHVIEDIRIDIPYGRDVVIPADKAAVSRDLWRAINQKKLIQLFPQATSMSMPSIIHIRDDVLQERNQTLERRCKSLEEENRNLQEENKNLRESNKSLQEALKASVQQQNQLDSILNLLQSGGIQRSNGPEVLSFPKEVADGNVPMFFPSDLVPKDTVSRIEVKQEVDTSSDVSGNSEKLRKLRRKEA
jgi:predicted nuclease with TOPRIM domain